MNRNQEFGTGAHAFAYLNSLLDCIAVADMRRAMAEHLEEQRSASALERQIDALIDEAREIDAGRNPRPPSLEHIAALLRRLDEATADPAKVAAPPPF